MELHAEERLEPRPDAFVGAVVHVDEPGLPVARKGTLVHRVAVVLAGDVAAARGDLLHRLVHAAMTVGQLVRLAARGEARIWLPRQTPKIGRSGRLNSSLHLRDERAEILRVTGAVADEDAVRPAGEPPRSACHGARITRAPRLRRERTRLSFAPASTSSTRGPSSPPSWTDSFGATRRNSSRCISTPVASCFCRFHGAVARNNQPRIVPCSRSRRVRVRVSMPVTAGTPSLVSQSPRVRAEA